MATVSYQFDATGINPANLVIRELHTVTEINATTYNVIVPIFAPFYLDNLKLYHIDMSGVWTEMNETVDYDVALPYIGASRSVGKMVYGGVSILTEYAEGTIAVTYQTIGGPWVADANYVLTVLAEKVYNPRTTVWELLTNVQETFPPINHDQRLDYVYDSGHLINAINGIAHEIHSTRPVIPSAIMVGLGNVEDLPVASNSECDNLLEVDTYVTMRQLVRILRNLKLIQ